MRDSVTDTATGKASIESLFHFVWYGAELPQFAVIAIASALQHNPQSTAILWHEPNFVPSAALQKLLQAGLSLRPIDFAALCVRAAEQQAPFDSNQLLAIYKSLSAPAAKSNLLRLLAIYLWGGIYLDTDTLTLRDLSPLRETGAFCGNEYLLWPSGRSKFHPGALVLDGTRWLCGRIAAGERINRQLLPYYAQAANNAVLGFSRQNSFCAGLLDAATQVPEGEWTTRFRFGTHLLQQGLKRQDEAGDNSVRVLPPAYFYPQGPVMSLHYFRTSSNVATQRQRLISESTHVIHWYASVAALRERGASHIRAHQQSELYSHLCAPYLKLFDG